jgi:LytS/YehU family sensor histidine kinase
LAYKTIKDKMASDKLASERQNENLKTELSLLRSQVNPHFMFNVLNNMVALAANNQTCWNLPSLIVVVDALHALRNRRTKSVS